MPSPRFLCLLVALLSLAVVSSWAHGVHDKSHPSPDSLDAQLQECAVVQRLNAAKAAHAEAHAASSSSMTARLFAVLFPGGPAVNALLATLYISGPPNLLLALCPTDIDPASLSVMVAFAVGGLMGDTLFHLLPEIFLGEDDLMRARLVLVEPNRNLLLGLAILVGFMAFVAMDKGLRIATGGGGGHDHGHGHGHGHGGHEHAQENASEAKGAGGAVSSAMDSSASKGRVSHRKGGKDPALKSKAEDKAGSGVKGNHSNSNNPSVKLGGYLNLIADFTHNITDGLAMSASFYASPTVGATTAVAVFFHEIPHEVGDFALLVQSGFSKRRAMAAQFVTAIGALLGTLIGIAVQELGRGDGGEPGEGPVLGIWGTTLTWGDMLLPFTAGTFLYVGTVSVIPELLETGPHKAVELRKALAQFAAVALGAGIMLYISWHE